MSIDPIKFGFMQPQPIAPVQPLTGPNKIQATDAPQGFGEMLSTAMQEVDGLQKTADKQIENLVLGREGVTPHEAMLALEKADTAFQLMNQIRGKIVRAYEEVLRTQV